MAASSSATPQRQLSLLDSTSIIVGIIIGAGFYGSTPTVARSVPDAPALAMVWGLGGLFALVGSLCYAELATAYPAEGGDFVYLSRGFGRPVGFLFAWTQLWVVRPGTLAFMAFVFATYATQLKSFEHSLPVYAVTAVVVLSAVNILGVRQGKWTQNALTAAKVLGLAAVLVLGFWGGGAAAAPVEVKSGSTNYTLALILVMYAYSGWNEMSYVAAEVRDPQKNILRALLLGTLVVMVIYLALNAAFLYALGLDGLGRSNAVAAEVAQRAVGDWGGSAVAALVCISALGAMNGMTFTGSRIYYALGQHHRMFAALGRWSPKLGTPVRSLVFEAAITLSMIAALGLAYGADEKVFQRMVNFTGPLFWLFLGLSALSLIALRQRDPDTPRPFQVPFYPWTPLVLAGGAFFMLYSSVTYAFATRSLEAVWPLAVLVVGSAIAVTESRKAAADR